ncbi:MAG: hypothetical protein WCT24_00660 [Patescibacteria group bacterium]
MPEWPPFVCPFCHGELRLPKQYGNEYRHSCACGAGYLLDDREVISLSCLILIEENGAEIEFRLLSEIDHLSEYEGGPVTEIVDAIFWRVLEN